MRTCGSIFLESVYDESPYIPFIRSVFKGETIGCPAWAFISQRPWNTHSLCCGLNGGYVRNFPSVVVCARGMAAVWLRDAGDYLDQAKGKLNFFLFELGSQYINLLAWCSPNLTSSPIRILLESGGSIPFHECLKKSFLPFNRPVFLISISPKEALSWAGGCTLWPLEPWQVGSEAGTPPLLPGEGGWG